MDCILIPVLHYAECKYYTLNHSLFQSSLKYVLDILHVFATQSLLIHFIHSVALFSQRYGTNHYMWEEWHKKWRKWQSRMPTVEIHFKGLLPTCCATNLIVQPLPSVPTKYKIFCHCETVLYIFVQCEIPSDIQTGV